MRLARVGEVGHERPVVVTADGSLLDLRPLTHDLDAFSEVLASGAQCLIVRPDTDAVTDHSDAITKGLDNNCTESRSPTAARPTAARAARASSRDASRRSGSDPVAG